MSGNRIWAFATVLVVGAVLVLGWLLGASPLLTRAATADDERLIVEQQNEAELVQLRQMREQYEQMGKLRVDLATLRISLPGELDSDFVYASLASIQAATGATAATITTGEAVPYGAAAGEETGELATTAPSSVPSLYTVPVTITFDNVEASKVLAFATSMQRGPRLFLVTSVTGDGNGSSTIEAYTFVLYDESAPRGGAAQALAGIVPGNASVKAKAGGAPQPTETASPEPEEDPTPTPTPTP